MAKLKVTQVRSAIGTKPKQRGTLRALGLGGIGKSQRHSRDRPRSAARSTRCRTSSTVDEVD